LATDLAAAREFYHGKLGLQIDRENENAIVFRCGNGTHLDVTESTVGTADQQTQAAWQVNDIRAEVAELHARGIKIEDYDTPGLKTKAPGWGCRSALAPNLARGAVTHRRIHDSLIRDSASTNPFLSPGVFSDVGLRTASGLVARVSGVNVRGRVR
jgi:catechol 2,3-dioxygenase-like lactoylglutathione lyase family enzyme